MPTSNGAESERKMVRFAAGASNNAKRSHEDRDDDVGEKRRHKRPHLDRSNEDELDNVDEYEPDDQREHSGAAGAVPSEHALLEAKRERRLKRQAGGDEKDDTHIDNTTSLASEGIAIEPFHMNQEKSDGSGFFDGDTYVFRKRDPDDEPDAWLDSLSDTNKQGGNLAVGKRQAEDDSSKASSNDFDHLDPQELYARILPLVSDTETVMQALVRYGNLLKRKPLQRGKDKKALKDALNKNSANSDADAVEAKEMAKTALNDLTVAANALLLKGKIDIYQKTRNDLLKLLPDEQHGNKPVVHWEYEGSQDHQIHGLYTTQQMQGWIQAGYFVGPSAVRVRTVTEKEREKSMQEDLLSDLMDDDEEESAKPAENIQERGEWMVSDHVNFNKYSLDE